MGAELIMKAATIAAQAHAKQKRRVSGDPYVNHLLRVANDAAQAGLAPDLIAAALLHDIVEDTHWTFAQLETEFSPRIVTLVRLLTKWWPDNADKEVKREEKPKYYAAILADQEAIELKLLDRADNLRDMAAMLPREKRWAERYLTKTQSELSPLLTKSKNKVVKAIYEHALRELSHRLEAQTKK